MLKKTVHKTSVSLREKKLKNGNISLYLDIYIKGKRHYEFLNLHYNPKYIPEKREVLYFADIIVSKTKTELFANDNNLIPTYKKRANYIEYFEKLCQSKPQTEKAWKNTLNYLKEFTKGHISFSSIDETWLKEFQNFLLTKISNNTAYTYFSKIKASLVQALKDRIINNNPCVNVKQIKKTDIERDYLSQDEVNKLSKADCNNINVKYAFLFACNTGLRISDIRRLTWKDIKTDKNQLIITQKKTQDVIYLPLNESALSILENIKKDKCQDISNKIFNLPCGTVIDKHLKKWKEMAKIDKHITFHTSRHSFATIALNCGIDFYTVSKLLGHKDFQNTMIYAKVVDESMKKAVDRLPKLDIEIG